MLQYHQGQPKKGKEEAKEAEEKGMTAVTESDMANAIKMRDAVFAEPHAKKLLSLVLQRNHTGGMMTFLVLPVSADQIG